MWRCFSPHPHLGLHVNMSFVSSPIGASRPSSGSNPTSGPMLMLMTNESVGGETDQSLNCPICQLHLRNPRVLPCLHSFCLLCLQTHVGQSRHFPCPVCRMVSQVVFYNFFVSHYKLKHFHLVILARPLDILHETTQDILQFWHTILQ